MIENSKQSAVSMDMIKCMSTYMVKRFSEVIKASIFSISAFKASQSVTDKLPGNMKHSDTGYHHEAHVFPMNTPL